MIPLAAYSGRDSIGGFGMIAGGEFLLELERALLEIGLAPSEEQLRQMDRLRQLVLYWNSRLNLTRIVSDQEVAIKHFVDSLMPLAFALVPAGSRVADVGSGAGFPGIPLKIWDESLSVTLIESTTKKAEFLRNVAKELSITVEVVGERAESVGANPEYRQSYDLVIARAVAPFAVLCEYCLPLVRIGGSFVAMKGRDVDSEIAAGERAMQLLGGHLSALHQYDLPLDMGQRSLAVVKKVSPTPPAYPRRAGIPKKRPL